MPARDRSITVSELNLKARRLLEQGMEELWVSGELSRVTLHTSGHWYFTLKDAQAAVSGAMFARENAGVAFVPEEGMQVELYGRTSLYETSGRYQFIATQMELAGRGDLQKQFEALKNKLAAEGLFDEERKKPLPSLPQRIGVITSPTGAAVRDIIEVLVRRFPHLEILLAPVPVQGEGAAKRIAQAIEYLNEHEALDLLIVGRGGGSLEDLWAFNEERVAYAIAASALPIISAVGHEIDFTLADFAADVRAPTPSAAAELAVPEWHELEKQIYDQQRRVIAALRNLVQQYQIRFERVATHAVFREPAQAVRFNRQRLLQLKEQLIYRLVEQRDRENERIARAKLQTRLFLERSIQQTQQRVDESELRIKHSAMQRIQHWQNRVSRAHRQLELLSPLAVLSRGYSITLNAEGVVVRSAGQVEAGEQITTRLVDGALISDLTQSNLDQDEGE
jgi:exodeoxyribonuclease VII large subunit